MIKKSKSFLFFVFAGSLFAFALIGLMAEVLVGKHSQVAAAGNVCTLTNNASSACAGKTCSLSAIAADTSHANWTGTGCTDSGFVPAAPDSIVIPTGYALTIDQDFDIGPSGDSTSASSTAITVQGSGTVTVASGTSVTLRGNAVSMLQNTAGTWLTVNGGTPADQTVITFDATQAATPTNTHYYIGGGATNVDTKVFFNGSAYQDGDGQPEYGILVKSNTSGGAGTGYVGAGSGSFAGTANFASGDSITAAYVHFLDIGTATIPGIFCAPTSSSRPCQVTYSLLERTGGLRGKVEESASGVVQFNYNFTKDTLAGAAPLFVNSSQAQTSGTREIIGNYFDAGADQLNGWRDFIVHDNWFGGGFARSALTPMSDFSNNVIIASNQTALAASPGVVGQNYWLTDSEKDNFHIININNGTLTADSDISHQLFDWTATAWVGSGDILGDEVLFGDVASQTNGIRNVTENYNIVIPSGTGYTPGALVTFFGSGSPWFRYTAEHNTYYTGRTYTGTFLNPAPVENPSGGYASIHENAGNFSTLTSAIASADQTSVTVAGNATAFAAGSHLKVDDEIMLVCQVTGTTGGTLTFGTPGGACPDAATGRGILGTTAATHNSGAAAWQYPYSESVLSFKSNLTWDDLRFGSAYANPIYKQWLAATGLAGTPGNLPDNTVDPDDADYNWKYNAADNPIAGYRNSGNGYSGNFTVTPGAHDASGDPEFLDPERAYATFPSKYLDHGSSYAAWDGNGHSYSAGDKVKMAYPTFYNGTPVTFVALQNHTSAASNRPGFGSVETTLAADINNSQTSITLAPGSGVAPKQVLSIDNGATKELVYVCAFDAGTNAATLGVSACPAADGRGYNSTAKNAHAAGTPVIGPSNWRAYWAYETPTEMSRLYGLYQTGALMQDADVPGCDSSGCSPSEFLINWTKYGFSPTNALVRNAASDGTTVGAMTFVDVTPPDIAITNPEDYAGGTVDVTATVIDDADDVAGVQFKLDGSNLGSEITTPDPDNTYSVSWNTSPASEGPHTLAVVARDGSGNSTTTSISVIVKNSGSPSPPRHLAAAPGEKYITVSWLVPGSAGGAPITGYLPEYKLSSSGAWLSASTTDASTTTFTLGGIDNGTSYDFRVSAINSLGTSAPSAAVTSAAVQGPGGGSFYMPPDALNISNFAATPGDGQVLLSWNTPSDPAFQKTMIVRKTAAFPVSLTDGTKIYEGTGASYNDTGLINGTTYYYAAFVLTDGGISTMPVAQAQAVPQSGLPAPEPPEGSGTTTPPSVPPSSSGPAVRLVNDNGTFYLIQNNLKRGITNPGILHSYGLSFSDAVPASAGDQSLPASALLPPNNGALVKSTEDPTVYLVSGSRRYGFVSAAVFGELGFNFGNVVIATDPELQSLPLAGNIDDPQSAHLPGVDVDMNGTVYWINSNNAREPYPDLATYNSWHLAGDFRSVVPANGADRALPEGASVVKRTVN